jgi:hypothetical protein
MQGSSSGGTKVTVSGPAEDAQDQAAVTALCAAVERAVLAYRPEGMRVREVVVMLEEAAVMLDEGASPLAAGTDPTPVYVDVYDSGYGHGI